jgi:glycerophosphoryl diester phosphodiesterase
MLHGGPHRLILVIPLPFLLLAACAETVPAGPGGRSAPAVLKSPAEVTRERLAPGWAGATDPATAGGASSLGECVPSDGPAASPGPRRCDPIFKMLTPLLFAHRGGVKEQPESTMKGFRHAAFTAKVDVLEMDVQATRDGRFVVWHGPALDHVRIEGESLDPRVRPPGRNRIDGYFWRELDGKAWVADPPTDDNDEVDLQAVPKDDERRLTLLEEVLRAFPDMPMNIEMKESVRSFHVPSFARILYRDRLQHPRRTIVVASLRQGLLQRFQEETDGAYPTNVPLWAGIGLWARHFLLPETIERLEGKAVELPHCSLWSGKGFIERIHAAGGGAYVFLSGFSVLCPALDKEKGRPRAEDLFAILDRGVDGIMTDRPAWVRCLMDKRVARPGLPPLELEAQCRREAVPR